MKFFSIFLCIEFLLKIKERNFTWVYNFSNSTEKLFIALERFFFGCKSKGADILSLRYLQIYQSIWNKIVVVVQQEMKEREKIQFHKEFFVGIFNIFAF